MGSHSFTCHPTEVNTQSQFKVHTGSTDRTIEDTHLVQGCYAAAEAEIEPAVGPPKADLLPLCYDALGQDR